MKYSAIVRSGASSSNGSASLVAPAAIDAPTKGSTANAASTRLASSAAGTSGNGISTNCTFETSTPAFSRLLRTATSGRFLSVLTETFLPSSCLRSVTPPLGASSASHALSSVAAPATPAASGLSGRFCALPFMIEVTLENPI